MLGFPAPERRCSRTRSPATRASRRSRKSRASPRSTPVPASRIEGKPLDADFAVKARKRYYCEIDRRKKKAGADIFVDKLPILSAEAKFLRRLFPGEALHLLDPAPL